MFGLPAPQNAATVVLAFVLGVASMYALGTLVAARAPKASTASATAAGPDPISVPSPIAVSSPATSKPIGAGSRLGSVPFSTRL